MDTLSGILMIPAFAAVLAVQAVTPASHVPPTTYPLDLYLTAYEIDMQKEVTAIKQQRYNIELWSRTWSQRKQLLVKSSQPDARKALQFIDKRRKQLHLPSY